MTNQPTAASAPAGVDSAEAVLWQRWRQDGDELARHALLEIHLPYARAVAATLYRRRTHDDIEFEEYLQLARVGLLESFERYDPSQAAQFRTFATRRMQGAILNGLPRLTEKNQQIALLSELRRERLEAAKLQALENVGRSLITPSASELPARVKNPEQSLFTFLAEVGIGLALGVLLEGTGMIQTDASNLEPCVASPEVSYFKRTELQILRQRLADVISTLNEQEKTVIRSHYLQENTFDQIGQMLDVKRSRIAQIHQQALRKLRTGLAPQNVDIYA